MFLPTVATKAQIRIRRLSDHLVLSGLPATLYLGFWLRWGFMLIEELVISQKLEAPHTMLLVSKRLMILSSRNDLTERTFALPWTCWTECVLRSTYKLLLVIAWREGSLKLCICMRSLHARVPPWSPFIPHRDVTLTRHPPLVSNRLVLSLLHHGRSSQWYPKSRPSACRHRSRRPERRCLPVLCRQRWFPPPSELHKSWKLL